jgi:hypothetical protein
VWLWPVLPSGSTKKKVFAFRVSYMNGVIMSNGRNITYSGQNTTPKINTDFEEEQGEQDEWETF